MPRATKTKSRLGRGLSALVSEPVSVSPPNPAQASRSAAAQPSGETAAHPSSGGPLQGTSSASPLRMIPTADISPNRFQPRQAIDESGLEQLAASIRTSGVLQPIAVRRADSAATAYELIAGERRWRAAQLAGLKQIPALLVDATDQEAAEAALVENIQREDLNPIERAEALGKLIDQFGLTQAQVAAQVGLDRSSVANLIRLLELEPEIQGLLRGGTLSLGHGKALLSVSAGADRITLANTAVKDGWSVRHLERAARSVRRSSGPSRPAAKPISRAEANRVELERQLGEYLGTRVRVESNASGSKGRMVIDFYALDQLEGVLSRIGFSLRP